MKWLMDNRPEFMHAWEKFREANPKVNKKNFVQIYKQVTKKGSCWQKVG